MVYPYATLSDTTEVVHSELKSDGRVKVYIEKAVHDGFHNATCYLPDYTWENYGLRKRRRITKKGKTLLCNNDSHIPPRDLRKLLVFIEANSSEIIQKWYEYFEEISYYC